MLKNALMFQFKHSAILSPYISLLYVLTARHQDTNYTNEIHIAKCSHFIQREELRLNGCASHREGETMHLRLNVIGTLCSSKY